MSMFEIAIGLFVFTLLTIFGIQNYVGHTTTQHTLIAAQQMDRAAVLFARTEYCDLETGLISSAPIKTSADLVTDGYLEFPLAEIEGTSWSASFTDAGTPLVEVTSTNSLVLTTIAGRKNAPIQSGTVTYRALETIDIIDDTHKNALYKLEYSTLCGVSN